MSSRAERLAGYSAVSTSLALIGDRSLRTMIDEAPPVASGIGGRAVSLEIDGRRVFAKRVPLTDLERLPEHLMSTANVFGLPVFCQYGIGSPGFGVWRELAVHTMTTNWVLSGECDAFPLMYHWRVLPESSPHVPDDLADVERVVDFWEGSPAVRRRVDELGRAAASVVFFMEYLPGNLREWFGDRMAEGGAAAEGAAAMVERDLASGTSFMNSRGLLHFDAHFENIMTDGERLYFTDFGLAVSNRFELSAPESEFFRWHLGYDRCYTVAHLLHWLITSHVGRDMDARDAVLRACAAGEPPPGLPEHVAAPVLRHAAVTLVANGFFRAVQNDSRTTPFPVEELRSAGAWPQREAADQDLAV